MGDRQHIHYTNVEDFELLQESYGKSLGSGMKSIYLDREFIQSWLLSKLPRPVDVKLFDDVGLVYEVLLAKMELLTWLDDLEEFRRRTAYFEEVEGKKSYHYFISDIKGKGQIGRTSQYLTHWYYPYKAKFHPQMVKAIINWMGLRRGEVLLDPFVGSGTALIEAKTIGVNSIGIDIDFVCILQSRVKCDILDVPVEELEAVPRERAFEFFERRRRSEATFARFSTSEELAAEWDLSSDRRVYEFYLLTYLYALSDYTYVKRDLWVGFNRNLDGILDTLRKWSKLKERLSFHLGEVRTEVGDARNLNLPSESVDGIITSPPYSIAVDYIKQDMHAFNYLGINPDDLSKNLIGLRGRGDERIKNYQVDMRAAFEEMHRVLKPKRRCAVIIGDVTYNGERLPIKDWFIHYAKDVGFEVEGVIRRPILGGYARLRYEYILMFRKV